MTIINNIYRDLQEINSKEFASRLNLVLMKKYQNENLFYISGSYIFNQFNNKKTFNKFIIKLVYMLVNLSFNKKYTFKISWNAEMLFKNNNEFDTFDNTLWNDLFEWFMILAIENKFTEKSIPKNLEKVCEKAQIFYISFKLQNDSLDNFF